MSRFLRLRPLPLALTVSAALLAAPAVSYAKPPRPAPSPTPVGTAAVSLASTHARITAGNTPELRGRVTDRAGAGVSGAPIVIYARGWGQTGYDRVATTSSAGDGSYTVPVRPEVQTSYVAGVGDLRSPGTVISVHMRVQVQTPAPGSSVRSPVALSGYLLPAYSGVRVGVAGRTPAGYRYLGQGISDAAGRFTATVAAPAGTYAFVVYTSATRGTAYGSKSLMLSVARPAADVQPSWPIRAAFVYPWFPEGWGTPGTRYTPSMGEYDMRDAAVLKRQIWTMRYAGMAAGISSWWGQGTREDRRLTSLLEAARGTPFRWSVYYEPEGQASQPSVERIRADLAYIKASYGAHPSYLRIGGKPVVFVWGDASDSCATAARWRQANTLGVYVVLKGGFPGYTSCPAQPNEWHQYAPANRVSQLGTRSFAVSPGFWQYNQGAPRLVRSPAAFDAAVAQMVASRAKLQLVTTFNEWGEGTAIESATAWASGSGHGVYADILHRRLGTR